MKKAKYSAKEVISVSSLGNGHTASLPLINSFVDHTVFYVGADSSHTVHLTLQFVDILYAVW